MKRVIFELTAILCAAGFLNAQEPKTNTTEVQTAVDLYKQRVSEGAKPTLTIKNGEAKLSESTTALSAGEFTTFNPSFTGGEFTRAWSADVQAIEALKSQVETLKNLNSALEEELAKCKGKP